MTVNFPLGTVTLLFTDIEGSTQLWEQFPAAMQAALARHDVLLRDAIETGGGTVIRTTGDGLHAVFSRVSDSVEAALICQQALAGEAWTDLPHPLRVRISLHTGEAEFRAGDYYGSTPNRTARLMSVAAGGQTLLSAATAELVRDQLPKGATLIDLGEHRLKDLTRPEHIFQLAHPTLPDEFPPIKSIDAFPNNLPIQLTSFVGRQKEIAEITALLETARLVTLTGSGGTGKTRLALEIGAQELDSYTHGVWLLELAPLVDPAQILPALAQTIGVQEFPPVPLSVSLIDYLRDKQLLLLLDNCEHLIEACARLADDLLHQCAGLKILASSREALGIAGEISYHTPSLADSESIRLFVERAQAAHPKFTLTDSNASSVAQICSRLDGIPLAIELAAARTKLLSPEQIASRLDDRFRLLVGGSRTALPRQQTLRALIDWSYDLLSSEEQQLLRMASVFAGGWTLEAIEAVADDPDVFEHLEQLVNKSLVIIEDREFEMRYFMLETIRQYAREKLFDTNQGWAARDRHFAYFDDLSERIWFASRNDDMLAWRDTADDEIENLRAALEWGMANHVEQALHLAANYCIISGWLSTQADGLTMVDTAIEQVRSLEPVKGEAKLHRQKLMANALFARGMVGIGQGNLPFIIQTLQEAIAISRTIGDKLTLGYSLEMFYVATTFINVPGGPEAAQEGLTIFTEEIEDRWGLGMAYQAMARAAAMRGDMVEKQKYIGKLREMMHEAPRSFQAGMFYLSMGIDESLHGNYEAARQLFEDGLEIFKRVRNRNFQLIMRSELGHIARHTGDFSQAKKIYRETIKGWQDAGNRAAIAHQMECFAYIAVAEEEPQRAIKLLSAAEALRERANSPMTDNECLDYEQAIGELHSRVGDADFGSLWAEGREMRMDQAIQLALN
jgi:predicted ATPase/class 3 adenylate cyclase